MSSRAPGPSFLVAALALSVALGGVGYAAGSVPRHSVGSAQLKKNAVTAKKIKPGAVTGAAVKDGALAGSDLAGDSVGGAQIDESSLNVPVKPGSVLLTGFDFQASSSTTDFLVDADGGLHTTTSSGVFSAPIVVPPGAVVTGLTLFVVDNGSSSIGAYVGRFVPSTGDYLYSDRVGSTGSRQALPLAPLPVLAGSTQTLSFLLPGGPDYRVYGARVDYR